MSSTTNQNTNARSMNGIISIDDGNGTTIEDGVISTTGLEVLGSINVTNLNVNDEIVADVFSLSYPDSTSKFNIDDTRYIGKTTLNSTPYINMMGDTIINGSLNIQDQYNYLLVVDDNDFTYNSNKNSSSTHTFNVNGSTIGYFKNTGLFMSSGKSITADYINLGTSNISNIFAPKASPTFTGTVSGITKSMVGLGSVDNTSDANKPVSTATTTALNLKMDKTGGTFTGDVTIQSGSKLFLSYPHSAIYDDAQLRIKTDDQMYLSTGTTDNCLIDLTSKDIKLNGATTITGNRLYLTDEFSSAYNSSFIESFQGKFYLSTQNGVIFRDGPNSYSEYCYLNSSGLEITGTNKYVKAQKMTLGTSDLQGLLDAKMNISGGTFSGDVTMDSSKNIIVGTGKIDFGSALSEKIILWKNTTAYGNYGFKIESNILRYNVGSSDSHIFSQGKSDGTKYEDIMVVKKEAVTINTHTSAGTIACTSLSTTADIAGLGTLSVSGAISGASLNVGTGTGTVTCGTVTCGSITGSSLNVGSGVITCGSISGVSFVATGAITCGSITVNSIKTYYMSCSSTDATNLGSGSGREITINFPTGKTFTTCTGAIVQIHSSSITNYQFVVTRVTAHNYNAVKVLIWNGSGSGVTPNAYTYNVIAWGT